MTLSRFGGSYGGGAANATSPYVQRTPQRVGKPNYAPAQRGFPERIPGDQSNDWLVKGAAAATLELPRVLETPLAPFNKILKEGKEVGGKGLLDHVLGFVGSVGPLHIGNVGVGPTLGDVVNVAGDALQRSGTFTSALVNAKDIARIQKIQELGLGLDSPVPDGMTDKTSDLSKAMGIHQTVGDYYKELADRGFFSTTDPTTGEIKTTSPQEIADQTRDDPLGVFQFGDKKISDNGLADLAFKIGTDPTNWVFGLGLIGKGAKAIGLAEKFVGLSAKVAPWAAAPKLVGNAAHGELEALRGIGYMDDMVQSGLRASELLPASAGAQALAQGSAAQATLKAIGFAFKQAYLPGRGSLGLRYLRGSLIQNLGYQAVSRGAGLASQAFDHSEGVDGNGDSIKSGIFSTIHDASESILNEHPLSGNQLFVVLSMFKTPIHEGFVSTKAGIRAGFAKGGSPDIARMAAVYGEGSGRSAENALYRKLGGAPFDETTGRFDLSKGDPVVGRERAARMLDRANLSIAFKRMLSDPKVVLNAKSMDHLVGSGAPQAEVLREYANLLLKEGKISWKDRQREIQDWAENHVTSYVDGDGAVQQFENPGGWALPRDVVLDQWNSWDAANEQLAEALGPLHGAVIGRSQSLTQEGVDVLIAAVDSATKDGMIPTDVVRGLFARRPAMFVDPAIPRSTAEYFASLMNEGVAAGRGVHAGAKAFTYDADELMGHLTKLRDKVPTGAELYHEGAAAESKVIDDTQMAGQAGPLKPGGVEKIWTQKEIDAYQLRSTAEGHQIKRDLDAAQQYYKDRWTRRGNYRPETTARRAAADLMTRTKENGGTSYDPISGKFDEATSGYSVGAVAETLETVAPDNTPAMAEAAARVAREYPGYNVGTWKNPETGLYEVDPSRVIDNLDEAMALAKANNQKAIYDIAKGEDIPNPDYRAPGNVIKIDTTKPIAGAGEVSLRQPPGINELEALVEKNRAKVFQGNNDIVDGLEKVISDNGKPGIALETTIVSPFGKQDLLVSRGADGSIQGILGLDTESIGYRGIYVKESLRRSGVATSLYDKAESMGYDVRTPGAKTNAGKEFVASYLKAHPGKAIAPKAPVADLEALRVSDQAHVDMLKGELLRVKKSLLDLRSRSEEIGVVPLHYTFRNSDGSLSIPADELALVQKQTKYVRDNFPGHELKKAPGFHLPWDAADSAAGAIFTQRSNLASILFDWGPLAKITQAIDWATEPVSAGLRRRDTQRMLYSTFMEMGGSESEVGSFIGELARRRHEAGTIGPMKIGVARYENSLLSSQIQQAGEAVWGAHPEIGTTGNKAVMDALKVKYGGQFYRALDQASNSLVRRGLKTYMKGEAKLSGQDILSRVYADGYSAWQKSGNLSAATRFIDKTMYPMFRFYTSIRWQAMNLLENDLLGLFQDGIKVNRFSPMRTDVGAARAYESAQAKAYGRQVDPRLTGEAAPDTGGIPAEMIPETGAVTAGRFMDPVMRRQFDFQSAQDVSKAIDELPLHSPEVKWMVDHFGVEKGTWSQQLDQMWREWDTAGVDKTLAKHVKEVQISDAWTPQEINQMVPFMLKLGERQSQIYDDIAHIQLGNTDRSRLERALNSYWAYWPISYQIKTTKWMIDLMTNRLGGRTTNLGGAYLLSHLRDTYSELMVNDPEFSNEMESNQTAQLLFNMMFPSVPWDQGVALSRIPRYVGGNILNWWPAYAGINTPADAVSKSLDLGSRYDVELWTRLMSEWGVGKQPAPPTIR